MIKLNITSQNFVYSTDQQQPYIKEDPKIWPRVFFVSSRGQILKKIASTLDMGLLGVCYRFT